MAAGLEEWRQTRPQSSRCLWSRLACGPGCPRTALEQAWIKNDWCPLRRESFLLGDHVLRLERIHFEVGQNLVHDSRINLLAPRSISSKQGVETQVVNVPWNAFAVPRDSFQSSGE